MYSATKEQALPFSRFMREEVEDQYSTKYAIILSELPIREKEKYYELLISHGAKLHKVFMFVLTVLS